MDFYEDIIGQLKKRCYSKDELHKLKMKLSKKYGLKKSPTDIQIMLNAKVSDIPLIKLMTKPVRTISGVAVVAIMSYPFACPHGKCLMCPGGPSSVFGDIPQSYTGKEPATLRALRNDYDSYLQVFNRLEQYVVLGHNPEKVELIIMGGTFPSFPVKYRDEFVKYSYKAMNDFSDMFYDEKGEFDFIAFKKFFELPGEVGSKKRITNIKKKLLKLKGDCTLTSEKKKNETSMIRCVAMALETRPDYGFEKSINDMLSYGGTRVELGVQSVYDSLLKKINRGHTVADSVKSTQLMKDSFLKVGYHMMPGLPGSSVAKDIKMFLKLWSDQKFRPDALKIYPSMVLEGTGLHELWKQGKYNPITTNQAALLIAEIKKNVPKYVRIMRVQRDIPTYMTTCGVDRTNLRQYVDKVMHDKGYVCNCIRCREPRGKEVGSVTLKRMDYKASNGKEVFLSLESSDSLVGFLRLRVPFKPFRKEITDRSVGVRELHVYGKAVGLGKEGKVQHKGYGTWLMEEAEKIAKEELDANKMLVISGVGVREYYRRKFGYINDGIYVSKKL